MFAAHAMVAQPRLADISLVSVALGAASSSASSVAVSMPSGTVQGDVMVAAVYINNPATISAAPSGWVLATSLAPSGGWTASGYFYYKVAGASEAGPYTWTATSAVRINAAIATFRGVANSDTVNASSAQFSYFAGTATDTTAASVTTSIGKTMLVTAAVTDQATAAVFTEPSGMTICVNTVSVGGIGISYAIQTNAGSSGDKVTTFAPSEGNVGTAAFLVALRPASVF